MAIGDTLRTNVFAVDLHTFQVATYQKVEGLKFGEVPSVSATDESLPRKLPNPQEVTLSRPVDASRTWVDWVHKCAAETGSSLESVTITQYGSNKLPVARCNLTRAWASEYSGPTDADTVPETVTIAFEDISIEHL
ncbi:phage tail protein [Streptomyces sp. NPDC001127]|uniref:phage tail protein n=1 Tax=Streptomyces sp. NPDC001127 TaxID=3154377 RepID=UPI003320F478